MKINVVQNQKKGFGGTRPKNRKYPRTLRSRNGYVKLRDGNTIKSEGRGRKTISGNLLFEKVQWAKT